MEDQRFSATQNSISPVREYETEPVFTKGVSMEIKQAIITGFMGKLKDRFCEYHEAKTPEEKIAAVSRVRGAKGIEIIYPYECEDLSGVQKALRRHRLGVAAVNANIKGDPEFVNGSSSVNSKKLRDKAIRFICEGMDTAGNWVWTKSRAVR